MASAVNLYTTIEHLHDVLEKTVVSKCQTLIEEILNAEKRALLDQLQLLINREWNQELRSIHKQPSQNKVQQFRCDSCSRTFSANKNISQVVQSQFVDVAKAPVFDDSNSMIEDLPSDIIERDFKPQISLEVGFFESSTYQNGVNLEEDNQIETKCYAESSSNQSLTFQGLNREPKTKQRHNEYIKTEPEPSLQTESGIVFGNSSTDPLAIISDLLNDECAKSFISDMDKQDSINHKVKNITSKKPFLLKESLESGKKSSEKSNKITAVGLPNPIHVNSILHTNLAMRVDNSIETVQKSNICEVCGKTYIKRSSLLAHKQSHIKKHRCEKCGRRYPRKQNLDIHMKSQHCQKIKNCANKSVRC